MKKTLISLALLSTTLTAWAQYDVIVVGSGGAGLSAAIAAKEAGASVLVLEKMSYLGGNTNFASGGMNAAGTKQQIAAGVTNDSPELFYQDTMKGGHNLNDPELLRTLTENARYAEEWLLSLGADFCFQNRRSGGQSIARSHGPCDGSSVGAATMKVLKAAAEKDNIAIQTNSQVTKLIMKDGRVTGVEVKTKDGVKTLDAKSVVLATGGFGANAAMVEQYRPELKGFSTTNHAGAQGEGIALGLDAGAGLTDIEQIQIHPTVIKRDGHLISESMRGRGAILVNQDGKRFTNELLTRDVVSQNVLKQPGGYAYLIWDEQVSEKSKLAQGYFKDGYAVRAYSVEALATELKIPVDALKATFSDYWGFVKGGKDTQFERPDMLSSMDKAPFYAAQITPGIHHTMGGLKINAKAEVLTKDKAVIPGLFAAGEVTGGVHGGNRIGGNAVADIVTFGRIAGQGAAGFAKAH